MTTQFQAIKAGDSIWVQGNRTRHFVSVQQGWYRVSRITKTQIIVDDDTNARHELKELMTLRFDRTTGAEYASDAPNRLTIGDWQKSFLLIWSTT